jgi:hypothetical protein
MIKLVIFVAMFAGICWVGTTVPLGSHTLFGHLRAIAETKESQDLFDGTKQSAKPLVDNVRRRIAGAPDPTGAPSVETDERPRVTSAGPADAGPPQEKVTGAERRHLRKLVSSAEGVSARR